MKSPFVLLCVIAIFCISCTEQLNVNSLIKKNLKSRYTDAEIVSITPDSCPNMDRLFNLSLSLKLLASESKLNISKVISEYYQHEKTLDQTTDLCKKELDKITLRVDNWRTAYFSRSEKCFLVKYRYGNSDGLKTTIEDYYSRDPEQYKEGNYPYLDKEFDGYYGINILEEVTEQYKEFLLEIVNN